MVHSTHFLNKARFRLSLIYQLQNQKDSIKFMNQL